ncbi:YesL family protein [Enterococcus sp. DIV0086]|uniref:YesL family protein n=1 Tax=Enterococcus sp. DIV0086 TaxID=2774655 RepID=UPI003D2947CC
MNSIGRNSLKLGSVLIFIGKLQMFWFVVVFRYFIIGGIFPAIAAVHACLFDVYRKGEIIVEELSYSEFLIKTKENFKQSNIVGYLSIVILIFLYIDLRISYVFIQNNYITLIIYSLIFIFLGTFLYLIPSVVRYNLNILESFEQAFFLLLASPIYTIAMLLGMLLAVVLGLYIPVLVLVPSILILFSNNWFSYQAMLKLEKANENNEAN